MMASSLVNALCAEGLRPYWKPAVASVTESSLPRKFSICMVCVSGVQFMRGMAEVGSL